MNEPSTKKRHRVLVLAAVLVAPVFVGGVLAGKASVNRAPQETPRTLDEGAYVATDDAATTELATCQRKLARRKKKNGPSATTGGTVEPQGDAGTEARTVEVMEKEIKECKRSAMLNGAELCRSVRLHLDALLGLPKNDVLCVQRVRVSDYIEDDFEKCAAFKTTPANLDLVGYSDDDCKTILDAVNVAKSLDEEKLADLLNSVHQGCYGAPRKESP